MTLNDFSLHNETFGKMLKVIVRSEGIGNQDSQVRYGYCGKLNAKRFMKDNNDNYKWFEKKAFSDENIGKKGTKKILNIFLDNSGSFKDNDYNVNIIFKSLAEIEKRYSSFKFNLLRWGGGYIEERGEDRISHSIWNRTVLSAEFVEYYKKLNPTGKEYNIFLTDGGCRGLEYISCLNNDKSVIITQSANINEMESYCPNCKAIIEEDREYTERLEENIVKALEVLF